MNMYNLLEYSDNCADSSASLYQLKRNKQTITDAGNLTNVTTDDSSSFKYKSSFLGVSSVDGDNRVFRNVKIVIPLKYLGNLFRSLEMSSINCKIHLALNWSKDCVMSNFAGETTFKITSTKEMKI